jgi:hypothetical protein
LLAQPRQRGLALEQRAVRRTVGVHLQQQRIAQRRVVRPRIVQRGEAIRVVGVAGRSALDQRAFATQRVVDAGRRQQTLHVALGLLVALAHRERPGGRQQQTRSPIDFGSGQPVQPIEHLADVAVGHHRFVEAAFGQVVGEVGLPGGQRVPCGVADPAQLGQTLGGARVQLRLLVRRQLGEAVPQLVARQRVHAQPVTGFADREHRGVARQPGQPLARRSPRYQPLAQVGMQVVEDRDARQEGHVGRVEVGQQQFDERIAQRSDMRRQQRHRGVRVAARAHGRQRELQPERPAFGQLVQSGRGVAVDAVAEARARQLERLVEPEAQLRRADDGAVAIGEQVIDLEAMVGARGHHHAQVRRCIAQQIAQRLERRGWQALGLVDDQHDVEGRLRHLGQPGGDAFEAGRRRRFDQRVAEGRAPGAGAHRQGQALHEARHVVLRLRGEPRHHGAARQMLTPPLRQQRCLAEAGPCLHHDHRKVAQLRVVGLQARPCHLMARHARRRDAQQQVVGGCARRTGSGGGGHGLC